MTASLAITINCTKFWVNNMSYEFDDIIAKIPQALAFKKRHYYDDYFHWERNRPDVYNKDKQVIHIVDYEGREGIVTPRELLRLCGYVCTPEQNVYRAITIYNSDVHERGRIRFLVYAMRNKFKIIEVTGCSED